MINDFMSVPPSHIITVSLRQIAVSKAMRDLPFVRNTAELEIYRHDMTQTMIATLRAFILANKDSEKRVSWSIYPNWFEHFKDECFPKWLTRRFPVKKESKSAYVEQMVRICPHADIKWDTNSAMHLNFLVEG
jgi:hypothetical protein